MKSIVVTILIVFLCVNVGVLYYMVLFGDFPDFERRVGVLEKRVDSLIKREGGEVAGISSDDEVEVQVGGLVVLSDQQKNELVGLFDQKQSLSLKTLVDEEIQRRVAETGGLGGQVKEFFVPLGNAMLKTSDNNWKDTGLQTEIDLANYGQIKGVTFEATLTVPTGNGQVGVRLLDVTDGVVGNSELDAEGNEGVYRKSGLLTISEGARVLKVQMRTSLDYEGKMDSGRLRIVVGE
jgi:hypothetical protein